MIEEFDGSFLIRAFLIERECVYYGCFLFQFHRIEVYLAHWIQKPIPKLRIKIFMIVIMQLEQVLQVLFVCCLYQKLSDLLKNSVN